MVWTMARTPWFSQGDCAHGLSWSYEGEVTEACLSGTLYPTEQVPTVHSIARIFIARVDQQMAVKCLVLTRSGDEPGKPSEAGSPLMLGTKN